MKEEKKLRFNEVILTDYGTDPFSYSVDEFSELTGKNQSQISAAMTFGKLTYGYRPYSKTRRPVYDELMEEYVKKNCTDEVYIKWLKHFREGLQKQKS